MINAIRTVFSFLFFMIINMVIGQDKLHFFENEWSKETLIVSNLAEKIWDKKDSITSIDFFTTDSTQILNGIRKFEIEIENHDDNLDYYIDKWNLKESGKRLYTIHFYIKKSEEQFSKIYLGFGFSNSIKGDKGIKIDYIKMDGKETINKMKQEWYEQMGSNIPPPPLPPSIDSY